MFFIVAIICGINTTICGISEASRSMSGMRSSKLVVITSMPSRVSKMDRMAQQPGMLKQCGSQ